MTDIIQNPYSYWSDLTRGGRAIYNGKIYVGTPDTNPRIPENQVRAFYLDENGVEIDLQQPVRTSTGGVPVNANGDEITIKSDTEFNRYSLVLDDRNDAQVIYIANAEENNPQIAINHNDTLERNIVGSHDDIYVRTVTVSEAIAEDAPVGTKYTITDRDFTRWVVNPAGSATDSYINLAMSSGKVLSISQDQRLTPEAFGATLHDGVDQTPYMQALEDWGKQFNKPTFYNSVTYEMQTKLVLTRAPQMHGAGGGNGSLRTILLDSNRALNGTIFYSRVANDYCLQIEPSSFDFGGRLEDITVLGHLNFESPKITGHGVRMAQFGWSAQINNLSIEGFNGINLSIGYMQDTTFNSLTLLDGSNGPNEPALEFSAIANFIYFNNPHFEECSYFIRVRTGTSAPWEVQFNSGHFETGNYYNGAASSAPNPSLERRYTSPSIFSGETLRDWKFNDCLFVPCGIIALNADNPIGIDNQPYFIQFNECSGVEFQKCRISAPTSAVDGIRLESTNFQSSFGRNLITGLKFRFANPTRYALKTNNTTIRDVEYVLEPTLSSSRLYGIEADNGFVDNVNFACTGGFNRSEGYLLNSQQTGLTKVGNIDYHLTSRAFKYVSKKIVVQNDGYNEIEIPGGSIDLERYPHDTQFIKTVSGSLTITDIANANIGRKLYITNTTNNTLTITATSNIIPGDAIGQNETTVYFAAKDNVLRFM